MGNGFLDNLPDLELGPVRRKKKKRRVDIVKSAENTGPVIWHTIKCPNCGSEKVKVHTTRKPIRYLECLDCGHHFKAVER